MNAKYLHNGTKSLGWLRNWMLTSLQDEQSLLVSDNMK